MREKRIAIRTGNHLGVSGMKILGGKEKGRERVIQLKGIPIRKLDSKNAGRPYNPFARSLRKLSWSSKCWDVGFRRKRHEWAGEQYRFDEGLDVILSPPETDPDYVCHER